MNDLMGTLKEELNSTVAVVSPQFFSEKLQCEHMAGIDASNINLSKRVALMELENGQLRTDLDHVRIELNARIAANEGLKEKVTELYVEVQSILQEKQRLQNILTDMSNRLSVAEASIKWYQSQVHTLEAAKKVLQTEVNTYQGILKHRQLAINNVTVNYKQLSTAYMALLQKYEEEKQYLKDEINSLVSQSTSASMCSLPMQDVSVYSNMTNQLEITEEELCDTKMELKAAEERLLATEIAKLSMENVVNKQHHLISSMDETIQKCEAEKNKIENVLHGMQLDVSKIKVENENLQMTLLSSKNEQKQIKDAMMLLQSQLCKMIAQYKLLKLKKSDTVEKLAITQSVTCEDKCLQTLSREANNLFFQKLNREKQKLNNLEYKFSDVEMYERLLQMKNKAESSLKECLRQVIMKNKDLKEQLKILDKTYDENIDEGYGDNSISTSVFTDIPVSVPIHSVLLHTASNILSKSKDLLLPIEMQVKALQTKMDELQFQYVSTK